MLFDLRGRRRRLVQATYLALALLMGGGLVLFGIGGDVSGGLFNAFEGGDGGGDANSAIEERIDRQEERLKANPQNTALLQSLVRDYYNLAASQRQATNTAEFPEDAKDELRKAGAYWERYQNAADDEPNADTANYAVNIYNVGALNQPARAAEAARIIAAATNDAADYLRLVGYAALAKDKRTADLAAKKAVELAPKGQRKQVKAQAEALKQPQPQQQQGG